MIRRIFLDRWSLKALRDWVPLRKVGDAVSVARPLVWDDGWGGLVLMFSPVAQR